MVFNGRDGDVVSFSPFHTILNMKTLVFSYVFMIVLFCSSEAALNAMERYLIKKRKAPDIEHESSPCPSPITALDGAGSRKRTYGKNAYTFILRKKKAAILFSVLKYQ